MFSRGGSSRGARGGFGTRDAGSFNKAAPPQSTAENDDWDEGSAPTPVKKPDAAVQENGGSNRGRFGGAQENGSAGFQRGAAGQDFGDKQQSNGFSNNNGGGFGSGGFKQNNETNGEMAEVFLVLTEVALLLLVVMMLEITMPAPTAMNQLVEALVLEVASVDVEEGSSGDSRPAFGGNRNEGSNEQGGSQPNGFGGPRAAGGRFGNNTENSAANENGESNEGGAARGGGAFGRSAFGNRFAENSDAAPSRYANSNNCHNCNKPGHMSGNALNKSSTTEWIQRRWRWWRRRHKVFQLPRNRAHVS
uniref:Uncharacterized protein n=1 Tax=Ditylenchus dipsaci TaxID=166011 RepID=A0A915DAW7_9BILA